MQLEAAARLKELFTEAEKLVEDVGQYEQDWAHWEATSDEDAAPPDWLIEKGEEVRPPFQYVLESLYLCTVCMLDASGLQEYLKQFYVRFGQHFDAVKAASSFDIEPFWEFTPHNTFLQDLRQFLSPLNVLQDSSRYLRLSGVFYLENVLRNTASIIHKTGKSPQSEPEVYKAVRAVLEAIFPSARSPKSNFIKSAQEYKPDILIPEVFAAVEYKYADSEQKLKATVGQIADDVKGYTGDTEYQLFYAIFYVTRDFWGTAKFDVAWKEKGFPPNWRAFISSEVSLARTPCASESAHARAGRHCGPHAVGASDRKRGLPRRRGEEPGMTCACDSCDEITIWCRLRCAGRQAARQALHRIQRQGCRTAPGNFRAPYGPRESRSLS
jgi:hypothetical protein